MKTNIILISIIANLFLINSSYLFAADRIKIGEVSGETTIITYDINTLNAAIKQEDASITSIENTYIMKYASNEYTLFCVAYNNQESIHIQFKMYQDSGNLYMCRGMSAETYQCDGSGCSKCDFNLNWPPTGCQCSKGSGSCTFSTKEGATLLGPDEGFVERYLY